LSYVAASEANRGAVLNGLVIGRSALIVSAIVSRKISIGCLRQDARMSGQLD